MNQEFIELIMNIIVNTIDIIILYYLCCSLIEEKALLSLRTIPFGLLCGVILGFGANYSEHYLFRLLSFIIIMTMVILVSKKKIYDVLIIYAIIIIFALILQFPIVIVLNIMNLGEIPNALIIQSVTLLIVILVYKKMPSYKLLKTVEKEILLQLFFFILFGAGCLMFLYFNVEVSNWKYCVPYFSMLLVISFLGLFKTIKKLFFYTNKVPILLHDVRHMLMSIFITINSESDIDFVRKELNNYLKYMESDITVDALAAQEYEKNIISFIEHKRLKSNKKLIFDMQISYAEHNPNFPFPFVIHTLGLLLDNAIEAVKTAPICIKIFATDDILLISVANEYSMKFADNIEQMFQEGYSTKADASKQKRGYGLSNLSEIVTKHGGDILKEIAYKEEYKRTYLTINIDFSRVRLKELLNY